MDGSRPYSARGPSSIHIPAQQQPSLKERSSKICSSKYLDPLIIVHHLLPIFSPICLPMSETCLFFLCCVAADGVGAAPVFVRLSTGPGGQLSAGDPRSLRLLRHTGAA